MFALLMGAILLSGAIWLFVGSGDERVDRRIEESRKAAESAGNRPVGLDQLDEARDLSQILDEGVAPATASPEARFRRTGDTTPPPPAAESAVVALIGRAEGLAIVLGWEVRGEVPEDGFLVERIGPDGQVLYAEKVAADARSYRDEPLDAVMGARTYRVNPVVRDGTVARPAEKLFTFDLGPRVEFLGTEADGAGRFRLTIGAESANLSAEFRVAPGSPIGEPRPEADGRPRMDWTTGQTFVEVRGRRNGRALLVPTPEFAPDGRVLRDAESGEMQTKDRTVLVYEVLMFARVRTQGAEEDRWLQIVEN